MKKIFSPFEKGTFRLKNHLVMAPMTRSRAIGNMPNDLMATYYSQRSGAGLIITEGTSPSPEGLGYPRIPGIFSQDQVAGWKKVTDAVHRKGSSIFVQLMHTGRIANSANIPGGASPIGPSTIGAAGEIYTDTLGLQEHSQPHALTAKGIERVVEDFVRAAQNAIEAGFDGIEIHGANGYLPEQFLNPHVNTREDVYGGNLVNRSRFVLDIARRTAEAIGADRVGIRFSPYSTLGDLQPYAENEVHDTYAYLSSELNKLHVAYIHLSTNPGIPDRLYDTIRINFGNTIIFCNGLTAETAEQKLNSGLVDLVAFGRGFLANPDFVRRIEKNAPLNEVDFATLYAGDATGYTDYSVLAHEAV